MTSAGSSGKLSTADGRGIGFTLSGSPQTGYNSIYRIGISYASGPQEWTATMADQSKLVFDRNGKLIRTLNPNGQATTLTYSTGLLTKVTDPSGAN